MCIDFHDLKNVCPKDHYPLPRIDQLVDSKAGCETWLAQWGIDLVGPFAMATWYRKFLVVAVYYFSKWVEAESLATITNKEIMRFIWNNICCRLRVSRTIISNNGTQFNSNRIRIGAKT